MTIIGVLALQGAYHKHVAILKGLDCKTLLVKNLSELTQCSALIIPGGESTTMTQLMRRYNMVSALKEFASTHPVFGTCAGMILMADQVDDARVDCLQLLRIRIQRNAYGRQAESFQANIKLSFVAKDRAFPGVFIRAPIIEKLDASVETLASFQGKPVLVAQANYLAASFHPELSDDNRIHRYWLERMVY
ncbi:MAG: pyridoxal 5'-phosphate synthase glutaminase subunit PdxT [Thiohalomonadales bacterium]